MRWGWERTVAVVVLALGGLALGCDDRDGAGGASFEGQGEPGSGVQTGPGAPQDTGEAGGEGGEGAEGGATRGGGEAPGEGAEGEEGQGEEGSGGPEEPEAACDPPCGRGEVCAGGECVCGVGWQDGEDGCEPIDSGLCDGVHCEPYALCDPGTGLCVCEAGALRVGAGCFPLLPDPPADRDAGLVCAQWARGQIVEASAPWSGEEGSCDPGTLDPHARVEAAARLSTFRWMVGLPPAVDAPALHEASMACAVVSAYGPPGAVDNPHHPTADQECYSELGAEAAGRSNISWGANHPAQSISNFINDWDNPTTMGHRRWCLYPPLLDAGYGYYRGGGPFKNGMCMYVLHAFGKPAEVYPDWYAFPPPGYVPMAVMKWIWTFHSRVNPGDAPAIELEDAETGAPLGIEVIPQLQGFGDFALAWRPDGWEPTPGSRMRVRIQSETLGEITYEVEPVDCGP